MKEQAEFSAEEKELIQAIRALKSAIIVLEKHHAAALLQTSGMEMFRIATVLQHEMQKHADLLEGVLTRSQKRAVKAFVQSPQDYFDASPTFKQSYAPQSG